MNTATQIVNTIARAITFLTALGKAARTMSVEEARRFVAGIAPLIPTGYRLSLHSEGAIRETRNELARARANEAAARLATAIVDPKNRHAARFFVSHFFACQKQATLVARLEAGNIDAEAAALLAEEIDEMREQATASAAALADLYRANIAENDDDRGSEDDFGSPYCGGGTDGQAVWNRIFEESRHLFHDA